MILQAPPHSIPEIAPRDEGATPYFLNNEKAGRVQCKRAWMGGLRIEAKGWRITSYSGGQYRP